MSHIRRCHRPRSIWSEYDLDLAGLRAARQNFARVVPLQLIRILVPQIFAFYLTYRPKSHMYKIRENYLGEFAVKIFTDQNVMQYLFEIFFLGQTRKKHDLG
jgi:hypothetical protein